MFTEQIKSLASQLNFSDDEAAELLAESQEFYDIIEAHKAKKCPMAMSLAMAAQVYHINATDDYGIQGLIDDFTIGHQADVIDAVANVEQC